VADAAASLAGRRGRRGKLLALTLGGTVACATITSTAGTTVARALVAACGAVTASTALLIASGAVVVPLPAAIALIVGVGVRSVGPLVGRAVGVRIADQPGTIGAGRCRASVVAEERLVAFVASAVGSAATLLIAATAALLSAATLLISSGAALLLLIAATAALLLRSVSTAALLIATSPLLVRCTASSVGAWLIASSAIAVGALLIASTAVAGTLTAAMTLAALLRRLPRGNRAGRCVGICERVAVTCVRRRVVGGRFGLAATARRSGGAARRSTATRCIASSRVPVAALTLAATALRTIYLLRTVCRL
jgi:hypothetical protein